MDKVTRAVLKSYVKVQAQKGGTTRQMVGEMLHLATGMRRAATAGQASGAALPTATLMGWISAIGGWAAVMGNESLMDSLDRPRWEDRGRGPNNQAKLQRAMERLRMIPGYIKRRRATLIQKFGDDPKNGGRA